MSGFDNTPSLGSNLNSNISGIFSTKPTAKYVSGARTILKINGKIVGFAFGISWRIQTAYAENNTIDDVFPVELIPQRINVEGSMSMLHIPGQSAGTELWQPDALNFLFQQYITIEVRDSATDQLLFYTSKAMITSRSEEIKVDSLANVSLTWKAIGFQDERKPELAEGAKGSSAEENKQPQSRLQSQVNDVANKLRNFKF